MRCRHFQNQRQCRRLLNAGTFCWEHRGFKKESILSFCNFDLELLILGYFDLEEILTTFFAEIEIRDMLVEHYYIILPTVNETIKGCKLVTLKYLYGLRFTLTDEHLTLAVKYGHLEILKYLRSLGFKMMFNFIEIAAYGGYLDIVKYCVEAGLNIHSIRIDKVIEAGYLEILKYLYALGIDINRTCMAIDKERIEILKYLLHIGYPLGIFEINLIKSKRNPEIIKFVEEYQQLINIKL